MTERRWNAECESLEKYCTGCDRWVLLDADNFYKQSSSSDGFQPQCKSCCAAKRKKRYEKCRALMKSLPGIEETITQMERDAAGDLAEQDVLWEDGSVVTVLAKREQPGGSVWIVNAPQGIWLSDLEDHYRKKQFTFLVRHVYPITGESQPRKWS